MMGFIWDCVLIAVRSPLAPGAVRSLVPPTTSEDELQDLMAVAVRAAVGEEETPVEILVAVVAEGQQWVAETQQWASSADQVALRLELKIAPAHNRWRCGSNSRLRQRTVGSAAARTQDCVSALLPCVPPHTTLPPEPGSHLTVAGGARHA